MCVRNRDKRLATEKLVKKAVSRTLAKLRELYPSEEALRDHVQRTWDEVKNEEAAKSRSIE